MTLQDSTGRAGLVAAKLVAFSTAGRSDRRRQDLNRPPRAHRVRRHAGWIAVFSAALGWLGGTVADIAAASAGRGAQDAGVGVTAPAAGELVTSRSIPVHVLVGSDVTGVRVWAGTRDVSRRFSRQGDVFTGRLPRSDFRPGTNRLLAQALTGRRGRGAAKVSFVVGRPASPSMLRVTSGGGRDHRWGAGPADVAGHTRVAGQLPVTAATMTPARAVLHVNGHRVSDLRSTRTLKARSWLVSRRDGLRFGRNRLSVTAWTSKGAYAVRRWQVTRGRELPLAEAGARERVVQPDGWARLDGTKSQAGRRGAGLSYRWQVVGAPRGARARLGSSAGAKARFRADVPGVYQVALSVTQRGRRAGRGSAPQAGAAQAAATATDVTTINVVPPLGPQGLYVDTSLYGQDDQDQPPYTSLWIEGQPYTSATGGDPDNWVKLDATTLAVIASGTHDQVEPAAGTIVVGQWYGVDVSDVSWNPTVGSAQYGSQVWLGTTLVASNYSSNAPPDGVGNPFTNLQGWIAPATNDANANYSWFGSDMLQVATRSAGDTATTNTMSLDGTSYAQTLPSGATGGYHLLVLGNDGGVVLNQVYGLTGNENTDTTTENDLAATISSYPQGGGATFLLQAFGTVPPLPSTTELANIIQNRGGRADVLNRLTDPPTSSAGVYALIAGPSTNGGNSWSPGWRAVEASYERTGTAGALTALLARDATGDGYIPFDTQPTVAENVEFGFLPLVYAAPSEWTNWIRAAGADGPLSAPTTAQSAAYSDLLAEIVDNGWLPNAALCANAPDRLRAVYCDTNTATLESLKTDIDSLSFDATTADGRYVAGDWITVQQSIEAELTDVITIRSSIGAYQDLFGLSGTAGIVQTATIGDAVKAAITKATSGSSSAKLVNIISALTDMASVVPEVGPTMTFLSGTLSLVSDLQPNTSSQQVLDDVTVTQDTAAATLQASMQAADEQLSRFGDYLVADPVKLQQGSASFLNTTPDTTDGDSAFVIAAEYATQRWLWGTMLAPDYTAWVLPAIYGPNPACQAPPAVNGSGGNPWSNVSSTSNGWPSSIGAGPFNTQWSWFIGYDNGKTFRSQPWGFAIQSSLTSPLVATGLPGTVTDPLFGSIDPSVSPSPTTNAGAIMPYFVLDYLNIKFPVQIPQKQWVTSGPLITWGCQPDQRK